MVYGANTRREALQTIGAAGVVGLSGCVSSISGGNYPSNDITFIVPYSTGTGYDTYARGIAPIWEQQFDTEANIVVDNVTGAGGRTAMNTLYNANPDGYTVGFSFIPGAAASQLVLDVEYDLREMVHFGRNHRATYLVQTGANRDINSWDDLKQMDQVTWGITGFGSSSSLASIVLTEASDINVEFVAGYSGIEALRASQQGEVDVAMYGTVAAKPYLDSGETKGLLLLSSEPMEGFEGITLTADVEELQGMASGLNVSRIVSAPGGLESDVEETLKTTFMDAIMSSEYENWANENGQSLAGRGDSEVANNAIDSAFETYSEYVDVIGSALQQ